MEDPITAYEIVVTRQRKIREEMERYREAQAVEAEMRGPATVHRLIWAITSVALVGLMVVQLL